MGLGNMIQQMQSQIPVGQQYDASKNNNQSMQAFQQSLPSIQKPLGKGGMMQPPTQQGMQGDVTYSATSGQQQMGAPNPYPNTVGMGDNQGNKPMPRSGGKGKGF